MADSAATVMTVAGPVDGDRLGTTLVHEHLLGVFTPPRDDTPEGWASVGLRKSTAARDALVYEKPLTMDLVGEVWLGAPNRDNLSLTDEQLAISELRRFTELGGHTVVDFGAPETGRDPLALARISEATGTAIVMAAGWRGAGWADQLDQHPDSARLADTLIGELTEGVGDTGIRAGILGELRTVDPSAALDRALLEALAAASRATGSPLTVGSSSSLESTLETLAVLESEGVDPARVALGGAQRFALDPDALNAIFDRGVFVAFDRLGRIPTVLTEVDDHDIATAIGRLGEAGRLDRVLVSQDISSKIDLRAFGGGGYGFVLEQFVPYFRGLGGGDDEVRALLVDNPRRFLTGEGSAK